MIIKKYVLAQVLAFVVPYQFKKIVSAVDKKYQNKTFTHWEHFICLSYGQLAQKQSLRNIVLGLENRPEKLYHLGIRSKITLSTLSYANRNRSWIIYQKLAHVLIQKALKTNSNRKIFTNKDHPKHHELNEQLQGVIYALDASIISLCLSVFQWAKFRKKKEELSCIHS